jgi:rubrerythrin
MVDALHALNLGIEREKGAQKFYFEAVSRVRNESSKKMFAWLANEELGHAKTLEKARAAVQKKKKWPSVDEYSSSGDISEPLSRTEFPKLSESKGAIKEDIPEMEILSKAIADERDAMSFYAEVAEGVSDPEGKKMLQTLSAIEKGHLELLEEEYEWLRRSKETFTIHRFELRKPT